MPRTETRLFIARQKGRYLPAYALRFIALLREELGKSDSFQLKYDF